jgi:phosphoadenosine phosphosulfate reductase
MLSQEHLPALNEKFEQAYPQAVLRWAVETFGDKLAVVTSFQPTGIVTLHMLQDIAPQVPVLTLDTGLLFDETCTLIDTLEEQLALNLHRIQPEYTVEEQAEKFGPRLWEHDSDACCHMRKVLPLKQALKGYQAWFTGLRRDQSARRANTPIVEWDERNEQFKIAPFATWTEEMIWTYMQTYELPYNELHDRNYPSIGCWPCTRPVDPDSGDKRGGRWTGSSKTECGIHTS